MDERRWERVRELARLVAGLDEGERRRVLDRECRDDPELRELVERALAERMTRGSTRWPENVDFFANEPVERPERIGPYRIIDTIAHGGFGVVYLAEQLEPLQRTVALKMILLGMDTRAVVARFEIERQALALMDHPNIAQVYDAGSTPEGRPYFAMEYVPGVPITEYCDRNRLSIDQRLALFLQVCSALQHAHQKGVIHRDLKPSNV
ncbi:MAG: serine/threonine-protein kinase, partial [Planctomycetota bacterium]